MKITTGSAAGLMFLSGCLGEDEAEDYPPSTMTFVNAYSEGGGVDTNMREIQPYLEEELDTNFDIDYRDGAGTRIAANTIAEEPEMHSIGGTLSPATPAAVAIDEQEDEEPDFTLDDIQPIGTVSEEAALIRVREDEDRFTTIEELVEYAEDNPGEITVGSSGPTNRNTLSIIQLMQETDAEFQIVPFDGGGPTETALLQQEVDVAARSVYNSADVNDETLCLAVYAEENPEPDLTDDAPPVNEALGTDIEYDPSNGIQFYFVSADAADEYPDRLETLADALESATQNEDYIEDLEEIGEEGKIFHTGPDETDEILEDAYDTYSELAPLFDEYVQN